MRIEAYISDWAFDCDLTPQEAACLTHVNYSFGLICDGVVSTAHLRQLDRFCRMQQAFPHLKTNLSIGGWGAGGFSEAVATQEGRERLAQSAIQVVTELNLSGIDWDWEYPGADDAGISCSPDDPRNMSDFLVLMREKLDTLGKETGRYYEQSIAVGAGRVQDYHWAKVLPALDTVNLMTYDMGMNGRAGHMTNLRNAPTAAYSAEQSAADFHNAGVPKEKLLLGAAFYFHVFEGVDAVSPMASAYAQKGRNFGHDALDDSWEYRWDETAQAAVYLKNGTLLSGDDPRSLHMKREFVEEEGLGGFIIWELNHDRKHILLPCLAGKA